MEELERTSQGESPETETALPEATPQARDAGDAAVPVERVAGETGDAVVGGAAKTSAEPSVNSEEAAPSASSEVLDAVAESPASDAADTQAKDVEASPGTAEGSAEPSANPEEATKEESSEVLDVVAKSPASEAADAWAKDIEAAPRAAGTGAEPLVNSDEAAANESSEVSDAVAESAASEAVDTQAKDVEAAPGAAGTGAEPSANPDEATPEESSEVLHAAAELAASDAAEARAEDADAAPEAGESAEAPDIEADAADPSAEPAEAIEKPLAETPAAPEAAEGVPQLSVDELMQAAEQTVIQAPQEDIQLRAVLEAVIYVAEEPLTVAQLAASLQQPPERIRALMAELIEEFEQPGHGICIREIAGGYKMATKPEHHDGVRNFVKSLKPPLKLSLPALETLAVIAYKQPVTGPEVLEIRGVQGGGVMKTLLDRKLIAAAGRKNVIGKPILYKTTKEFLIQFGLKDLSELPSLKEFEELKRLAFDGDTPAPAEPEPAPETPSAEEPQAEPAGEPAASEEA